MRRKQTKEYVRTEGYRLRMTPEDASRLDELAILKDMTKADIIREALKKYELLLKNGF